MQVDNLNKALKSVGNILKEAKNIENLAAPSVAMVEKNMDSLTPEQRAQFNKAQKEVENAKKQLKDFLK